jgi:radical SAM superfamily enzyme YgiQ (UPF0313 family)
MKILLVNPPYRRLRGVGAPYFPLGLGYLATALIRAGHKVKIYNGEVPRSKEEHLEYKGGDLSSIMSSYQQYVERLDDDDFSVWQEFRKSLREFEPDVVGISVRTPMLSSALKLNQFVKEWRSDCPIIWGGSHSTIMQEESMALSEVDYLVYGEGEKTIVELADAIEKNKDFSSIPGIYYKNESGEVIKNNPREYVEDLDELSMPARDAVFDEDLYDPGTYADLMGSRGCPFLCSYCSAHSMWSRKVRYRSIPDIIEEVKILRNKYDCEIVRFLDDSFTLNRSWVEELCHALIKENLDLKWGCLTRVNLIDEKLLKLMIKAGCYRIDVGVESGSPRILKMMRKNISLKDVLIAAKLFDKHGIDWTAFFIVGFPYETREELQETADFMKKINPYRIVLSSFTPYPATEDHARAKELGVLPEKIEWGLLDHNSPNNFFMKNVGREEYQKFFSDLSEYVSLRNTSRIRGKGVFYLKHPITFFRKVVKFIKIRL